MRRYVPGGGMDQPLVWFEGSGVSASAMRWLHADERGSIIATTDNAGAATPYTYGPYGEPGGGAWSGSRYRYTGQIALPEVQLYHMKARVYDPNIGRFLQTDPIGYDGGMNMYAYVGNDPVNFNDAFGLQRDAPRRPQPIDPCGVEICVPPPDDWEQLQFHGERQDPSGTTVDVLDEVVVTGRVRRRINNTRLNFHLPFPREQYFIVDASGAIRTADVFRSESIRCPNGSEVGKQVFDRRAFLSGDRAVIHTHPDWAHGFPGPGDAVVPSVLGIPNYGISRSGSWVVEPAIGGGVTARLLSGNWGGSFNPSAYAAPGGNSGGSSSNAALCAAAR